MNTIESEVATDNCQNSEDCHNSNSNKSASYVFNNHIGTDNHSRGGFYTVMVVLGLGFFTFMATQMRPYSDAQQSAIQANTAPAPYIYVQNGTVMPTQPAANTQPYSSPVQPIIETVQTGTLYHKGYPVQFGPRGGAFIMPESGKMERINKETLALLRQVQQPEAIAQE